MRKIILSTALLGLVTTVTYAQGEMKQMSKNQDPDKVTATGGVMVAGWTGRIDPQSEKQGRKLADAKFITMGAGFHVTSGPAAIYWNARNIAEGNYGVTATFTQMKPAAHPEGYGLIVGGNNLAASNQSYLYFLVRQDGKFLVNHRADDSTVHKIVPWTDNAAINKVPDGGKATNALRVDFTSKDLIFSVNGKEVQRLARSTVDSPAYGKASKGVYGIRVNHNLDVHADNFALVRGKKRGK